MSRGWKSLQQLDQLVNTRVLHHTYDRVQYYSKYIFTPGCKHAKVDQKVPWYTKINLFLSNA